MAKNICAGHDNVNGEAAPRSPLREPPFSKSCSAHHHSFCRGIFITFVTLTYFLFGSLWHLSLTFFVIVVVFLLSLNVNKKKKTERWWAGVGHLNGRHSTVDWLCSDREFEYFNSDL